MTTGREPSLPVEGRPVAPEQLPPHERRVAEEMIGHMPDGRSPGPGDRRRTRIAIAVLSVVIVASVIAIVASVGGSFSSMGTITLIIAAYLFGLLPLVGAVLFRRHDKVVAATRARDGVPPERPRQSSADGAVGEPAAARSTHATA